MVTKISLEIYGTKIIYFSLEFIVAQYRRPEDFLIMIKIYIYRYSLYFICYRKKKIERKRNCIWINVD